MSSLARFARCALGWLAQHNRGSTPSQRGISPSQTDKNRTWDREASRLVRVQAGEPINMAPTSANAPEVAELGRIRGGSVPGT